MNYRSFLENKQYQHKVCGMVPVLAEAVQQARKQKTETSVYPQLAASIRRRLQTVSPTLTCGVMIGGAGADSWWSDVDLLSDTPVVVYLLSDITNIDSKFITFVKIGHPQAARIFERLYKHDATKEQ